MKCFLACRVLFVLFAVICLQLSQRCRPFADWWIQQLWTHVYVGTASCIRHHSWCRVLSILQCKESFSGFDHFNRGPTCNAAALVHMYSSHFSCITLMADVLSIKFLYIETYTLLKLMLIYYWVLWHSVTVTQSKYKNYVKCVFLTFFAVMSTVLIMLLIISVGCLFQTETYMTFTVRANFYVDSMNYLVSMLCWFIKLLLCC